MPDKVTHVVPQEKQCGISELTRSLADEMENLGVDIEFEEAPVRGKRDLVHFQHEFNIFQDVDKLIVDSNTSIASFHSYFYDQLEYYTEASKHLDGIIVHLERAKREISKEVECPVFYVPHGSRIFRTEPVDEAKKEIGLDGKETAFIFGFGSPRKNFESALSATEQIVDMGHPDFHLILSFSPHEDRKFQNYLMKCKQIASRKNIKENVSFINEYLDDEQIEKIARASDVIIQTLPDFPDKESASAALQRVLAAGRPALVRDTSHYRILTHGENSLKWRTDSDLAHFTHRVLTDDDLRGYLGKRAREIAEQTSWEKIAKRTLEVYEEVEG